MKTISLFLLIAISLSATQAQAPNDTINKRLYLLCKTWGYVKYFSQNKCGAPWDDLLNTTITQVLESDNNTDYNAAIMDMLNQAGNNRPITDQGVMPDTNLLINTEWINDQAFSPEVKGFLSTFSTNIFPDQSTCFVKFNDYTNPDAYGLIDFTQDRFSLAIDYTVESNRLTVMFYYWNVINYFFPYRDLMDQSWDSTLLEFIPMFRNSRNAGEFHINFLKLATRINDSHGSTISSELYSSFWRGTYMPMISLGRIEGKCVVKKVDINTDIEPGDIVTGIDGVALSEIEDSLALFIPASTPAALYRDMYVYMIRGARDSDMMLTLTDQQGQSYTRILKRFSTGSAWYAWKTNSGLQSSYTISSCGYGYVNMGLLQPADVPAMYDALKSTPAIIFDLRNYPKGTLWDLAPLLFNSPITSAIFYEPALTWTPYNWYYLPGWYHKYTDVSNLGTWTNPAPYSGKIFILVNQETQSQAEYTCQYLSYHRNAKVIGTQSAGADGNITRIKLPGGIYTSFTSLGTYYADGYQQQRNGVKIDSIVAPTIQAIREGKDEILLAALDCISGLDNLAFNPFEISVYPNPVTSGQVRIDFTLEKNSKVTISLFDITGRIIAQENRFCPIGEQTVNFDLNQVANGFYNLKIQSNGNSAFKKLIVR